MNEWNSIGEFADSMATLKEASLDDKNSVYMTELEFPVVNFDAVAEKYLICKNAKAEEFKSIDAVVRCGDKIVFIEFKNGSMDKERKGIRGKMKDSIFILADLLDCTIEYVRNNVVFVLVYNKAKNPRKSKSMDEFADRLAKLGHDRICRFGLDNCTELYFRNIITYNDEEFNEDIKESSDIKGVIDKLILR